MRYLGALLALLCLTASGCSNISFISPNDPNYARSGAPRVGEPALEPGNLYGRIQGTDGPGSR